MGSSNSQGPEDARGGSEPGKEYGAALGDEAERQPEENAAGDHDMYDGDWWHDNRLRGRFRREDTLSPLPRTADGTAAHCTSGRGHATCGGTSC